MDVFEHGLANGWPGEVFPGVSYGGLTARLLDIGPTDTWILQAEGLDIFFFVANFGDDRGWVAFNYSVIPTLTPHFPYGRIVTPD